MALGKTASLILAAVTASTLTVSVSTSQAQAGRPNQSDYFSTNGHSVPTPAKKQIVEPEDPRIGQQGALALSSRQSPQLHWFEQFDELEVTLRPSEHDRTILKRPLGNELERVQEYIKVAAKVAKNYRTLALNIRKLPVPPNSPGLRDYQRLKADFYDDTASVYEDLIRPRRTRTQEELQQQLSEVKDKADQLKVQHQDLMACDMDLRRTFNVHTNKHDNPLWQYVTGKR